jgi:hypothetical protein
MRRVPAAAFEQTLAAGAPSVAAADSHSSVARLRAGSITLTVPRTLEVIPQSINKFPHHKIGHVTFDPQALLKRLDPGCFKGFALRSICMPRSVMVLGGSCCEGCTMLTELRFELLSRMIRIEDRAFLKTVIRSVSIPGSGQAQLFLLRPTLAAHF